VKKTCKFFTPSVEEMAHLLVEDADILFRSRASTYAREIIHAKKCPNPKKGRALRGRTTKRDANKSTRSMMRQQACQVQMQAAERERHTQRTDRAPSLPRFSSNYGVF
jgi:hypothetical protein